MVSEITKWIMELMRGHGQLSVFIGVIIEQIIVPIPSPLIIMGAGVILILPTLSLPNALIEILWLIVFPGTIASTLGSFIGYSISYYGGKALIIRFQNFLRVDWKDIENLEKRFRGKREAISVFLTRAIPVFPISLVSIFAGLIRIPLKSFTIYTFLGSIFRCLFLGFLGWRIGVTYENVATKLDSLETFISILMLILLLGIFGYLYHKFRRAT